MTHERAVGAYNGPIRPINWYFVDEDETFEEPVFKDRRSIVGQYDYLDEIYHHFQCYDKEWVLKQSRK